MKYIWIYKRESEYWDPTVEVIENFLVNFKNGGLLGNSEGQSILKFY